MRVTDTAALIVRQSDGTLKLAQLRFIVPELLVTNTVGLREDPMLFCYR